METAFTRHTGVQIPLICGPMYPCSNPELVAAVSEAGGLGVVQPISLTYVHGHACDAADRAARLLVVRHRKRRDDAAHRRRQPGHHRETARELGQVHERDRVHGAQVVAVAAPARYLDHGVARLEHADARADGTGIGDREAEQLGEKPRPAGQRR